VRGGLVADSLEKVRGGGGSGEAAMVSPRPWVGPEGWCWIGGSGVASAVGGAGGAVLDR
jgi:hypothetical protein